MNRRAAVTRLGSRSWTVTVTVTDSVTRCAATVVTATSLWHWRVSTAVGIICLTHTPPSPSPHLAIPINVVVVVVVSAYIRIQFPGPRVKATIGWKFVAVHRKCSLAKGKARVGIRLPFPLSPSHSLYPTFSLLLFLSSNGGIQLSDTRCEVNLPAEPSEHNRLPSGICRKRHMPQKAKPMWMKDEVEESKWSQQQIVPCTLNIASSLASCIAMRSECIKDNRAA